MLSFPSPVAPSPDDPWTRLTPAEREVLARVLHGDASTAIAARRGTAVSTVNKQIETAYRKLGVSSRAELAARYGDRV